ncbi:GGDEF domain-containing protein [Vibrio maerlii]|uniref:GGDEF domain-containing protein n=1 Tax=Vibrio maerlii TaxID=2231648 RepID=UPI000E3EAECD|nr:GGDEF domain-containing protein [Vibrio maerlii]
MVLNLQSKNELIREKTERSITDNLTGVFNWDYIDLILMKDASLDQGGIVLYLDGNNVKMINDNYGHDYGDLAIKMICDVIKSCVRREDSVIRMGGDEFVVVLKHCDEEGAVKIYEKIADALVLQSSSKLPFIDEGVSVAPGYCLFTNRKDFEHAIINADLKMLESKQESKLGRA